MFEGLRLFQAIQMRFCHTFQKGAGWNLIQVFSLRGLSETIEVGEKTFEVLLCLFGMQGLKHEVRYEGRCIREASIIGLELPVHCEFDQLSFAVPGKRPGEFVAQMSLVFLKMVFGGVSRRAFGPSFVIHT